MTPAQLDTELDRIERDQQTYLRGGFRVQRWIATSLGTRRWDIDALSHVPRSEWGTEKRRDVARQEAEDGRMDPDDHEPEEPEDEDDCE